jgi:outer membrane translocation and assembly module TamA
MRMDTLSAILMLAVTPTVAQVATGIHLVDVRFSGDTHLESADLRKCASDLKSRNYEGPKWLGSLADHVQVVCLQNNGYFKAGVEPSTEQLPDKNGTHQFVVTFNIHSGPQYRTGEIGFKNNHVFSAKELRSMFKLASGDVFSVLKIREGLEQMRAAYVDRRYSNFTPIPDSTIDDSRHVISLIIDCAEGTQLP